MRSSISGLLLIVLFYGCGSEIAVESPSVPETAPPISPPDALTRVGEGPGTSPPVVEECPRPAKRAAIQDFAGYDALPAAARVPCLRGKYGVIREDAEVLAIPDDQEVIVRRLYRDGRVILEYRYQSRTYNVIQNVDEVALEVECLETLCKGASVTIKRRAIDTRAGEIVKVFTHRRAKIVYRDGRRPPVTFENFKHITLRK